MSLSVRVIDNASDLFESVRQLRSRYLGTNPAREDDFERREQVRDALSYHLIEDFRREGLDVLLERLPQIASRTLVIWGRHDQVFLPAALENLLQQLPDARGHVIEDCGHVPYLERGAEVVAAITGFISTSRAREAGSCSK